MGYRNEVYIALKGNDTVGLYQKFVEADVPQEDLREFMNNTRSVVSEGRLYSITHLEDWKWEPEWDKDNGEDSIPVIVMDYFQEDRPFSFVRIGDDDEDVEIRLDIYEGADPDFFFQDVFTLRRSVDVSV